MTIKDFLENYDIKSYDSVEVDGKQCGFLELNENTEIISYDVDVRYSFDNIAPEPFYILKIKTK